MIELKTLSYSSLSTWLMCPRSWKYRYVDKVETPTNHAALFGTVTHKTVEAVDQGQHGGRKA